MTAPSQQRTSISARVRRRGTTQRTHLGRRSASAMSRPPRPPSAPAPRTVSPPPDSPCPRPAGPRPSRPTPRRTDETPAAPTSPPTRGYRGLLSLEGARRRSSLFETEQQGQGSHHPLDHQNHIKHDKKNAHVELSHMRNGSIITRTARHHSSARVIVPLHPKWRVTGPPGGRGAGPSRLVGSCRPGVAQSGGGGSGAMGSQGRVAARSYFRCMSKCQGSFRGKKNE